MEKLKCVIVDDDKQSMRMLSDFCQDVPYVDVKGRFLNSSEFIGSADKMGFDLC